MSLIRISPFTYTYTLIELVEDILPKYYSKSMAGIHTDARVFTFLLEEKIPKVANHIKTHGVPIEPIIFQWFLCLFVNILEIKNVLRYIILNNCNWISNEWSIYTSNSFSFIISICPYISLTPIYYIIIYF